MGPSPVSPSIQRPFVCLAKHKGVSTGRERLGLSRPDEPDSPYIGQLLLPHFYNITKNANIQGDRSGCIKALSVSVRLGEEVSHIDFWNPEGTVVRPWDDLLLMLAGIGEHLNHGKGAYNQIPSPS